jgi:flavin reductase (DIM6/NTAB) family NADH-FMN oxidoreductase RutF
MFTWNTMKGVSMTEKSLLFREVLGNFATGVAVVTTKCNDCYYGLTINSFTSVSLSPLLIQINIAKNTTSHGYITESGRFVVNILAEDQKLISTIFAGAPPAERFQNVTHSESGGGCPVIDGSLAYLEVVVTERYDGGDHTIFLGEVVEMQVLRHEARPLLYFRGKYVRMEEVDESQIAGSA